MEIEDLLKELGCDSISATKAKFLNDKGFFLEVVSAMLTDPGFERLGEDLDHNQSRPAFETAHMLKGIIANCGVSPMNDNIVKIVEPLRGADPDFSALKKEYGKLMENRKMIRQKLDALV